MTAHAPLFLADLKARATIHLAVPVVLGSNGVSCRVNSVVGSIRTMTGITHFCIVFILTVLEQRVVLSYMAISTVHGSCWSLAVG